MMHLPKGTGTFPLPCDALIARLHGPQGLLLMGHEMGLSFLLRAGGPLTLVVKVRRALLRCARRRTRAGANP